MKLIRKLIRFLSAILIIITIIVQYIIPPAIHSVYAAGSEEKPSTTSTQKTLYVVYQDYTITFKNLDKDAKVTYSSSDSKVASVSGKGVVEPMKAGTAIITATIKQNGRTYTSKINITVKVPYVSITCKTNNVNVGSNIYFTGKAYGLKGADLTWSSSNPSVARIGKISGILNAKAAGTTVITLMDTHTGKKADITVEVTKDEPEATPIPGQETDSVYKAPEGSDKAVYISGLDLSKKKGTYYTTSQEEYIETTRFVLYLDEGVKVPVNAIDLINHIMDMIEDETGYMFYVKQYQNINTFDIDSDMDKYFDKASEFKIVNSAHDRLNIAVANQNPVTCALGSNGVLLMPEDINLLDGTEFAIIHELLHVAWLRNGCDIGQTLCEGFSTYYTTLITQEDTVMNGVYDGYEQLGNLTEMINESTTENLFIETTVGWNSYLLGFRMMTFIMETYGAEAYRKMHDYITSENISFFSNDIVVAALKSKLAEDFFQAFAKWHQKNLKRFNDKDLSNIGDWLIENGFLEKYYGDDKNVTVPKTVTDIQEGAFSDNKSIETVTFPNTLKTIGADSFYDCDNLKEITIPDSVTGIWYCAFEECDNLKKVVLSKNITSIDVRTFCECVSLESIKIPEGVTQIGASAFTDCSSLTIIELPSTLKNIGGGAFYGCDKLTIYGKKGSYAETYAKENNIKFVAK